MREPMAMPVASMTLGQAEYLSANAWGLSTAIDIYGCDPEAIRSEGLITQFARQLCDLIGMKPFGEPRVVRFGSEPRVYGYSMVQLIETSLISAHFAEDSNAVYLDVFSCKWYDAELSAAFAKEFFRGERVTVESCLRR